MSLKYHVAGSHPSCYEVRVDAPGQTMPVLNLRCAASRPGKGDAVCSLVPMRHADNAIGIAQGKSVFRLYPCRDCVFRMHRLTEQWAW